MTPAQLLCTHLPLYERSYSGGTSTILGGSFFGSETRFPMLMMEHNALRCVPNQQLGLQKRPSNYKTPSYDGKQWLRNEMDNNQYTNESRGSGGASVVSSNDARPTSLGQQNQPP